MSLNCPTVPMQRFLGSTLCSFSCIGSFDCIFERMTPLKSTSNLTFSAAKSRKSHFSGYLALQNLEHCYLLIHGPSTYMGAECISSYQARSDCEVHDYALTDK